MGLSRNRNRLAGNLLLTIVSASLVIAMAVYLSVSCYPEHRRGFTGTGGWNIPGKWGVDLGDSSLYGRLLWIPRRCQGNVDHMCRRVDSIREDVFTQTDSNDEVEKIRGIHRL